VIFIGPNMVVLHSKRLSSDSESNFPRNFLLLSWTREGAFVSD
jgi:hypothetical protein